MLKRTKNYGLKSLIECTGIDVNRLSAYHIGFVLGPCINAGGRLDTAKRALALLNAKSKKEADILATDLKALNDSRKDMTEAAVKEAVEQVEKTDLKNQKVLVIFLPHCHESLAGIVAGRIRERYYRPVFVLTEAENGLKGSGRSIEAYHMYEEMNKCRELFTHFGGHRLAAGLSMPKENLEVFRRELNRLHRLSEEDLVEKILIDMQMPFRAITEEFVQELSLLEPFGKANTKPVFAEKNVRILNSRILGRNRNVLKLQVQDPAGTVMDAMYFGDIEKFQEYVRKQYGSVEGAALAITYYPGINEYGGRKTLQIVIQNYR